MSVVLSSKRTYSNQNDPINKKPFCDWSGTQLHEEVRELHPCVMFEDIYTEQMYGCLNDNLEDYRQSLSSKNWIKLAVARLYNSTFIECIFD